MTKIQIDPQTKDHPAQTVGTVLEPLFTWRGMDVYPVFGASQPVGETDSEPDEDEEDEGDPSASGGDTVSRSDFEKLRQQLSAADKNRSAAEQKLKELEDAKKDELTKTTERVQELEKQHEQDAKQIAELQLQNAFLVADTGITWHDPGDALALAERKGYLDGVVVDGKVDSAALATKLKEMSKAHSYLVKSEGPEEKNDKPPVRTGAPVGGKQKGKKPDEPDLSRYGRFLNR